MKVVCFTNNGGMGNPILAAFAKGCGGTLAPVEKYGSIQAMNVGNLSAVFWGILRGNTSAIYRSQKLGVPHIVIDHAYIRRGHSTQNYRTTLGSYPPSILMDYPDDRAKKFDGHALIKPLRPLTYGAKVLVLPPTRAIVDHYMYAGMSSEISLWNHNVKSWAAYGFKPIHRDKASMRPFAQDLAEARAVVSLHSNGAVEGLLDGVTPYTGLRNAAYQCVPFSMVADQSIVDTGACCIRDEHLAVAEEYMSDRRRRMFVNNLCYRQFHISEFEDGTAWRILSSDPPRAIPDYT